jgi:cytoskeletal protein RodZ
MRDRARDADRVSERTFKSRTESSATSTLWMVLTWVSIFFLLFKAFSWWEANRTVSARHTVIEQRRSSPTAESTAPSVPTPQLSSLRSGSPPTSRPSQQAPEGFSVTKCVGRTGTSYSDGPCPAGTAATRVAAGTQTNISDGLTKRTIQNQAPAPVVVTTFVDQSPTIATSNLPAQCKSLTEELNRFDVMARQPLSGAMQDWIRDQQRTLQSRKFALKC